MWRRIACSQFGSRRHVASPASRQHRTLQRHSFSLIVTPLHSARRWCASCPSMREVQQACEVLGVSPSTSYADVKRRYLHLAKLHHPDVAVRCHDNSSGDKNNRTDHTKADDTMVCINNAYSTVRSFLKTGKPVPHTVRRSTPDGVDGSDYYNEYGGSSGSDTRRASHGSEHPSNFQGMYDPEFDSYQPWHEQVHPLMYEMMWEEMRQAGYPEAADGAFCQHEMDGEEEEDGEDEEADGYSDHRDGAMGGMPDGQSVYDGCVYVPWRRGAPMYYSSLSDSPHYAPSDCYRSAAYARHHHHHHHPSSRPARGRFRRHRCHVTPRHRPSHQTTARKSHTSGDGTHSQTDHVAGGASDSGRTDSNSNGTIPNPSASSYSSTMWSDADQQAMIHMYRNGKSFEFIAHALGKDAALVVRQFNEWSCQALYHGHSKGPAARQFAREMSGYAPPVDGGHRHRRYASSSSSSRERSSSSSSRSSSRTRSANPGAFARVHPSHRRGECGNDIPLHRHAAANASPYSSRPNYSAHYDCEDDDAEEYEDDYEHDTRENYNAAGDAGADPYGYSVAHDDFLDRAYRDTSASKHTRDNDFPARSYTPKQESASALHHRPHRGAGFGHHINSSSSSNNNNNNNNNNKNNYYKGSNGNYRHAKYSHAGDARHSFRNGSYIMHGKQRSKESNSSLHRHGFQGRSKYEM